MMMEMDTYQEDNLLPESLDEMIEILKTAKEENRGQRKIAIALDDEILSHIPRAALISSSLKTHDHFAPDADSGKSGGQVILFDFFNHCSHFLS